MIKAVASAGGDDERKRHAEAMKQRRAAARDLEIPLPADIRRRNRCLKDPFLFHQTYLPHIFYQSFTRDRREMIEAMIHAARYSGDYALAGPRGEGKTRMAIFTAGLFLLLAELCTFPIVISKNQGKANIELANLKGEFEYNALLRADFPEVCVPIEALGGWGSRARMQTVGGHPTRMEWAQDHIIFPTIPIEALSKEWRRKRIRPLANGQIMASMGIDGPLRGTNYRNKRPDLALLDDLDDRESAGSETQTASRERIIDQDIAGLAGPGQRISRVMLCTVLNRTCVAAKYTDRTIKPSWHGRRYKAIATLPTNLDLWEQYLELRRSRDSEKDPDARVAHQFYVANRQAMDEGAEVANVDNYTREVLSDGQPAELSALQHYYNLVADVGWDNFCCEFQNDPPALDEIESEDITSAMIARRVSGLPHREVPRDTRFMTGFLDLGQSYCHGAVGAFRENAIGHVIDHPVIDVQGISKDSSPGDIERQLLKTLHEWADSFALRPYCSDDGTPFPLNLSLIDSGSGLHQSAVYQFVRERGAPFMASKGFGGSRFSLGKPSKDRRIGDHWYLSYQHDAGLWVLNFDADYWKRYAHERFRTPTKDDQDVFRPGTLSLFACPDHEQFRKDRREYCHQMVAEVWSVRYTPGKPIREKMEVRSHKNHWLDATAGMCAAASVVGVKLLGEAIKPPTPRRAVVSAGAMRPDGRPWL